MDRQQRKSPSQAGGGRTTLHLDWPCQGQRTRWVLFHQHHQYTGPLHTIPTIGGVGIMLLSFQLENPSLGSGCHLQVLGRKPLWASVSLSLSLGVGHRALCGRCLEPLPR